MTHCPYCGGGDPEAREYWQAEFDALRRSDHFDDDDAMLPRVAPRGALWPWWVNLCLAAALVAAGALL